MRALPSEPSSALVRDDLPARVAAGPACAALSVDRVGYLVPAGDFDGVVHSVFARACNISWRDLLLTLVAPGLGDGPTTLRLGHGFPTDLRHLFRPGDAVRSQSGSSPSRGMTLHLAGATVWRPAPLRSLAPAAKTAANMRLARAALIRHRRTHSSVIDREGGAVLAGLAQACRELDIEGALPLLDRLVGWGEGLTPAGDDVLVGWCAAFSALAGGCPHRRHFRHAFSAAILARAHRTTPIAAHYLRLAAQGHFNADVTRLHDALLCGQDPGSVAGALDAALDAGATSGADMVTGMIVGIAAWREEYSGLESTRQRAGLAYLPPNRALHGSEPDLSCDLRL